MKSYFCPLNFTDRSNCNDTAIIGCQLQHVFGNQIKPWTVLIILSPYWSFERMTYIELLFFISAAVYGSVAKKHLWHAEYCIFNTLVWNVFFFQCFFPSRNCSSVIRLSDNIAEGSPYNSSRTLLHNSDVTTISRSGEKKKIVIDTFLRGRYVKCLCR